MVDFPSHDLDTAPEASKPLLENSQKAFGRLPGLHKVMAESPQVLEGYQLLHKLFACHTRHIKFNSLIDSVKLRR